jgi:GLPGLI family protein
MKTALYILLFLSLSSAVHAQYTMTGKIEYERKVSVKRMYRELYESKDNSWYESMKAKLPQSKSKFFNLYFNTNTTVYKPGKKIEEENKWIGSTPVDDDQVYNDFKTGKVTAVKDLYGDKLIVQDSMKQLQWKIYSEIRTIADYKCRKAVAKICDSVYVVAFYTDDIPVSGGPHMFGGLPGMIMELAIPRLYTTWVATSVDNAPPKDGELSFSAGKGKKLTHAETLKQLQSSMKSYGDWGHRFVWWGVL